MPVKGKFKPFVGRCFELKNFTDMKKYPPVVLVMDEDKNKVMFLDNEGNATWVTKFYLRDTPINSQVFASPDTLTGVMTLIEKMRTMLVEGPLVNEKKKSTELGKVCARAIGELRDLGTRMQGVQFAPPVVEEEQDETNVEPSAYERDKAIQESQTDHVQQTALVL